MERRRRRRLSTSPPPPPLPTTPGPLRPASTPRRLPPPATPRPLPPPATPSSTLRDLSNFKTPGSRLQNPNSPAPLFFSAKEPPSSTLRRRPAAARRLQALEHSQSQSSRNIQLRRERDLKSLARSLSVWLNFLLQKPGSCGCNVREEGGERRTLKRQRSGEQGAAPPAEKALRASLKDVCSVEDVRERMEEYMSRKSCNEVLVMMGRICKNIDEGRLKMKGHCPIVTDLRLKEKATKVLMCYHPIWLQAGLHIVFGGELFLDEVKSDQEELFLKLIVENQFFSHTDLAKSFAYNKLVEGLYRPGYFEALGNIILKRFLLFVISLDKAKCESALPVKYGIDGLDGGSPLLLSRQSSIKSSRQVIHEFLSEAMHGEGDLLAHLVTVGCKVNYHQSPLAEYDFTVTNLFDNLQDGMILCRAIQLLQTDHSILQKIVAPSDTRKKNMQNCSIAFQYLKQTGVPLSDEDGVMIVPEDVVNGDKELTVSILWNIFLHMQVPLLVTKASLVEEIKRIKMFNLDLSKYNSMTLMSLLLEWIQVACERYHITVEGFASLLNGKVFHYLISYYIGTKEGHYECTGDLLESCDDPTVDVEGLGLVQSLIAILGDFPEIVLASDKLDQNTTYDERSLIMLLVFLASRLFQRKPLDQLTALKFRQSSCRRQDVMSSAICQSLSKAGNDVLTCKSQGRNFPPPSNKDRSDKYNEERASIVIQSRFRGFTARNKFMKIRHATSFLQTVIRAWLAAALVSKSLNASVCSVGQSSSDIYYRYLNYMIDRRRFIEVKESVLLIQRWIRTWNALMHDKDCDFSTTTLGSYTCGHIRRSTRAFPAQLQRDKTIFGDQPTLMFQSMAATAIQHAWRCFTMHRFNLRRSSAMQIQKHWRGWCARKSFCSEVGAIIEIQAGIRCAIYQWAFMRCRVAAVEFQRIIRGQIARNMLLGSSYSQTGMPPLTSCNMINTRKSENSQLRILHSVLKLQRWWRQVLLDKSRRMSTILIQCYIRGFIARKVAYRKRNNILIIQRWWRKHLFLKLKMRAVLIIQTHFRGWMARRESRRDKHLIVIIQRLWRKVLSHKLRCRSVLIIQACCRGWIARRAARQDKHLIILIQAHCRGWIARRAFRRYTHFIVVIQSYWKGWLVRKALKSQELVLHHNLKTSAANDDNEKEMMKRLVAMLSELHSCKSTRNIRYTCGTLNMAAEHSQKYCETLVAAGAVNILVKQLHTLNRGIPDQEILKYVLCTLMNVVRYPHLAQVFVNTSQSVETIFQELLRNKGEGYFTACDILKNLCSTEDGLEAIKRLQGHVRRLKSLVQDLERKVEIHKRNPHLDPGRDATIGRLNKAVSLLQLIASDRR